MSIAIKLVVALGTAAAAFFVVSTASAIDFKVNIHDDYALDTSVVTPGDCVCESTKAGSDDCSLRAAIQASNACASSGDTITLLAAGPYRLDINGNREDQSATGDLDIYRAPGLSGAKTISIAGEGNFLLADFDPGHEDRTFDIPATEDNITLNIQGLTLQFGHAPLWYEQEPDKWFGEPGGCIRALAGTLNLTAVNFEDCVGYWSGGAIHVDHVNLTLTSNDLGGNHLDFVTGELVYDPKGGALYARNSLVDITGAEFVGNYTSGSGGAIYVTADLDVEVGGYLGQLYMDDSFVEGNRATAYGGGLLVNAPFYIGDTSVIENKNLDQNGEGAGVFVEVPDADGIVETVRKTVYGLRAGQPVFML